MQKTISSNKINVRKLTMTAILAAMSSILMFFSFNVPLMPGFIKFDFSELPALIAAFTMGPVSGILVCLVKNLVNVCFTTTGGIGELSNFILGASFVATAGLIYKKNKTKAGALVGSLIGAAVMAVLSVFSNYYIVYPIYAKFMPIEAIIGTYQKINPGVNGLMQCLLVFNMPYTFIKGIILCIITFIIYKPLSPIIKGKNID